MDGQNGGNEPIAPADNGSANTPVSPTPEYDNNPTPAADAGAGFTPGGAIYSNPDLTVEKDAIPEEISNAEVMPAGTAANPVEPAIPVVANNAERVAAAFANTDATRNMMTQSATRSTATGDIRLAPTPKKGMGKLPLLIGVGVIAVMAVVIVVLLLTRNSVDMTQAFTEYYDYAQEIFENGIEDADDEDEEVDADEDMDEDDEDDQDEIEVDEDEDGEGEEEETGPVWLSNESILELRKKFDVFKRAVDGNKSEQASGIREKVETLDKYLKVAEWVIATGETRAALIEVYHSGGEDGVRERLQEMLTDEQEDIMDVLSDRAGYYYAAVMEMYIENERIGCIKDGGAEENETDEDEDEEDEDEETGVGEVDYACAARYYKDDGDTVEEQYAEIWDAYDLMANNSSIKVITQSILKLNDEIKAELEKA